MRFVFVNCYVTRTKNFKTNLSTREHCCVALLIINLTVVNGINHSERTSIINLSGSPFTAYDANKVDILGMDWKVHRRSGQAGAAACILAPRP